MLIGCAWVTSTYPVGFPLKAVEQGNTMGVGSVGWRKERWKEKRNLLSLKSEG